MPGTSTVSCDRCGKDVGEGGLDTCIIVSDLDPETGIVINLHFCRLGERPCARRILSKSNIKYRASTDQAMPAATP